MAYVVCTCSLLMFSYSSCLLAVQLFDFFLRAPREGLPSMDWIRLDWTGFDSFQFDSIQFDSIRFDWIKLKLDWINLRRQICNAMLSYWSWRDVCPPSRTVYRSGWDRQDSQLCYMIMLPFAGIIFFFCKGGQNGGSPAGYPSASGGQGRSAACHSALGEAGGFRPCRGGVLFIILVLT